MILFQRTIGLQKETGARVSGKLHVTDGLENVYVLEASVSGGGNRKFGDE